MGTVTDMRVYKLIRRGYLVPDPENEGLYYVTAAGKWETARALKAKWDEYHRTLGRLPPSFLTPDGDAFISLWLSKYGGNPVALLMGIVR